MFSNPIPSIDHWSATVLGCQLARQEAMWRISPSPFPRSLHPSNPTLDLWAQDMWAGRGMMFLGPASATPSHLHSPGLRVPEHNNVGIATHGLHRVGEGLALLDGGCGF